MERHQQGAKSDSVLHKHRLYWSHRWPVCTDFRAPVHHTHTPRSSLSGFETIYEIRFALMCDNEFRSICEVVSRFSVRRVHYDGFSLQRGRERCWSEIIAFLGLLVTFLLSKI